MVEHPGRPAQLAKTRQAATASLRIFPFIILGCRTRVVLAVYKRYAPTCPQTSRQYRRCICPWWIEGTVEGKYYRQSLKTRSWERATKLAREIEEGQKQRIAIQRQTLLCVTLKPARQPHRF
jgi:hypothetical protein